MNFGYYRFLLSSLKQQEILTSERGRKKVIEDIFSENRRYEFVNNRVKYGFLVQKVIGNKVLARIAKEKPANLHASPLDGFAEKQEEDWPGSYLLINLDDEKETGLLKQSGQVIAMQHQSVIRSPINCLRLLATKISEEILADGYDMSINPISSGPKHFWSVVDLYKDDIKKIVLKYAMPNILNLKNKVEDDLKEVRDVYKASKTAIILESETGNLKIDENNSFVKESIDYIEPGGGSYIIYSRKDGEIIKSDDNVITEKFNEIKIEGASAEELSIIFNKVLEKKHDD